MLNKLKMSQIHHVSNILQIFRLAPFGGARRKDYTPVSWRQYFEKFEDVETESGTFRVYLSPEPDHLERPRIVTLHGGGYSGLSWALFTVSARQIFKLNINIF